MTCKHADEFNHGDWVNVGDDLGQVIGHNCDGRVILRFGRETRVVHPSRMRHHSSGSTPERATCEFCATARRYVLMSLAVLLFAAVIWIAT